MKNRGLILTALILVAAVANLNLTLAMVALPDIGVALQSSQTALNIIAVGYSLGLAASVLYLGAIGDRYGRKFLLLLGTFLAIPASLLAGFAPDDGVLAIARVFGGLAAGMAYPTTLALITAIWPPGHERTKAIALWSAFGGASAALGPLVAGLLLTWFWWGSVFLVTVPLAVVALLMAWKFVPGHVHESKSPVDHLGGVLSMIMVGTLVVAINFLPQPQMRVTALIMLGIAVVTGVLFVIRQLRANDPLYDLHYARRRTFWVAGVAGVIVFGAFMGATFIGVQYLQIVLGYSTLASGLCTLPLALAMVIVAPRSAKLVSRYGSRTTLLIGYVFFAVGFLIMLLTWTESASLVVIIIANVCLGIGIGLAGTPAARSLTGSVPVQKVGMASGTADLQRDLGGAIIQSGMGSLLTAGYALTLGGALAASSKQISGQLQVAMLQSYGGAESVANQYPQYSSQILGAAKNAFLVGDQWAFLLAVGAVIAGFILVFFAFPKKQAELDMITTFQQRDSQLQS